MEVVDSYVKFYNVKMNKIKVFFLSLPNYFLSKFISEYTPSVLFNMIFF